MNTILPFVQFHRGAALAALCVALLSSTAMAAPKDEALSMYASGSKPEGDALLKKMRADPKPWGTALLELSKTKGLPERLYIDAARAFIYVGETAEEVSAAADNLAKAPFTEIDRSEWLYLCQKIAQREVSAMPCARRILDEKSFRMDLLGGDDGVGKDYALAFILFQMPEQAWNRELGDRLWRGADNPSSQVALLSAMFYAVSLRDDAILAKFADDETRNPTARARANVLLTQMSSMEKNASQANIAALRSSLKIPKDATEEDLRTGRRVAMKQVSRLALVDFERYTFLIRAEALIRWKDRLRKQD